MSKLAIAHVVLSLVPGGTERLVIELVRRTREHCRSIVCCLDDEGEWAVELIRDGVPVVALGRRPGFHPSLGWRIASVVRPYGSVVLHCHQYTPFVYGAVAAALTGAGLVFTEHGRLSDARPSLKRRLVNPLLGRVGGAMFAVSDHLREHMLAEGLPARRVAVIRNGIDPGSESTPEFRQTARAILDLPADAFVVGTAARLDPVKDLRTLLTAFSRLRSLQPAARLVVFGDGPARDPLCAQTVALDIANWVTFAGHRPDVRTLLPALDVFANSSISEGISLTILEAMAASLPVVATAVGGTPEVVTDDRTGLLVPPRDPTRLCEALAELSANSNRRSALGVAGRRRVLKYFTIDRMVSDYVAQYERVVPRPS
jgi:glycosyltransferase involved in cell wall biosynthesis